MDDKLRDLFDEAIFSVDEAKYSLEVLKEYAQEELNKVEDSDKYKELRFKETLEDITDDELEAIYDELDEFDAMINQYEEALDYVFEYSDILD